MSPDGGFIDSSRIQELLDRFLVGQWYASEMTPEKSLYDLAAQVFAANQVMLREHFRCVPPIIAYSNRTFYQNQILPLRIPRTSERIEPPLVDLYVEGGVRDHHDRNDCEAQAIADEIEAILKDERFANRTIGVVSLLGTDQAKYIDSVVSQKCDAAELHRRKFLCGDARAFQGSERHIMFLSLVVDRNSCRALSGNMFDQRFNVAASRAQDRMYLVQTHSVESGMIRFHYGPWDQRYYHVLAYLEARELINVTKTGKAYDFALTDTGKEAAERLRKSAPFASVVKQMKAVKDTLGMKTGSALKKLVYKVFEEEVANRSLGEVIE